MVPGETFRRSPRPSETNSPTTPKSQPLSFVQFLAHVRIESDPDEGGTGGPIPFDVYDYQRERAEAWADGGSEIILKPRQIGFSWLLAAYAYWTAAYHQSSHVALFSAGETEVKKLIAKVDWIHRFLPARYRAAGQVGIMSASFDGASTITGYPATKKAGIGTTLKLAAFDEAAFHAYLKDNQGAVVPALGDFGQLIILSTADPSLGPSGHFFDFYWASRREETNCAAVFLPADIRPGRDAAWFEREKRKYPDDEHTFSAFYPFREEDAFIGRSGLVFPQFDRERHVREGDPVTWEECISRWACYDLGAGDPTAVVPLGLYRRADGSRAVHQFGEWYKTTGAPSVEEIADYLTEWHDRAPFDSIEPDPVGAAAAIAESLRGAYSLPVRDKPLSRDKGERLGIHAMYLDNGWLTINARCANSIREYVGYRWRENTDPNSRERYTTGTPVDNHADGIDARGGALVAIYFDELNRTSDDAESAQMGDVAW